MRWLPDCPNFLKRHEPLRAHTSIGVGGPADYFAEPTSVEELLRLLRWAKLREIPLVFFGSGTNLLVSDRGFRGCVVRLSRAPFTRLQIAATDDSDTVTVTCGAGVSTQQLVRAALRQQFGPVHTLAGLPGSVGGAVAMNAQNIGTFVERVTVVTPEGEVMQRSRTQCGFGYRSADLGGGLVIQAMLAFQRAGGQDDATGVQRVLSRRRTTQELQRPSAGCAFKNPSTEASAGRLIDLSGLKGSRVGDACVSDKHANFIVNAGRSRSVEVLLLMEQIQQRVWRDHRVWLEPEVRIIGERWEQPSATGSVR